MLHVGWLVFGLALILTACDSTGPPDNGTGSGGTSERVVAATAVYAEITEGGAPIERIVLFDYDDPSDYQVVTPNDHVSRQPRFSPDKTKLVFGDATTGLEDAGPQLVLYDLEQNTLQPLLDSIPSDPDKPLAGQLPVWNADGTGFYFHTDPPPFSIARDVLFYDLDTRTSVIVYEAGAYAVGPVTMKTPNTLVVFSNEKFDLGRPIGYYLMDLPEASLDYVDNPHLGYIVREGIRKKGAFNLAWNDQRGLFAMAYSDSTFQGYKIAVTDLDGSYYRAYTSGNYIDDHPHWGPDGKTILFDRRELEDYSYTGYRLMEVDLETGAVREFVEPNVIDGAVALRFPDY